MHPPNCPEFEYDNHPHRQPVLKRETKSLVLGLQSGNIDGRETAADTRAIHARLFSGLVPFEYTYYAGHYRGENFRCLKYYCVGVRGDPSVGAEPHFVLDRMKHLANIVQATLAGLDDSFSLPHEQLSLRDKIVYAVAAACRIFEEFLRIHPYANGNGHAGRFIIWAILGRYNIWPKRFTIEPRPQDPPYTPYTDCIKAYRNGDHKLLEEYIFQCLS